MHVVIEIPKFVYDMTKAQKKVIDADVDIVGKAIIEGTVLPDNVTNGDMIKAIFPYAKTWEEKGDKPFEDVMRFDVAEDKTLECFDLEWWNEPYKAGDTDE